MTSNMCKQFACSSVVLAVIAIASAPASAQLQLSDAETASEINAANKLLRDGKVDKALEAFRHVVPGDQQRDAMNFNMAVAEYRNGNIDAAEKLFTEVAGTSTPAIASNSRYNLGNCHYTKAVQLAGQDKASATSHLRDAISHYRGALRGNSNNPDARANIELAGALIRKLEQEQQEEQKKQEQEQQNQGEASASDKSKTDEQKQDDEKNEKPGDESQKTDDQKSPGGESESHQQKPTEQQPPPKGSDGKQTQTQNMQQQSGDQQQPGDDEMPERQEAENQVVPAGDLKAAGQQDENKKAVASGAMAGPNAKDGLMTREEALKMLQSVRDRDMLRRMQQQRQERSRHVPVDRDW